MTHEQPTSPTGRRERAVDVLVVGAGPAGLALASRLAATGGVGVEVVDREDEPGVSPGTASTPGSGRGIRAGR